MGDVKRVRKEGSMTICGYCAMAPRDAGGPEVGHAHCYPTDGKNFVCDCGANGHKLTAAIAESMARYCHITVEQVYAAHGRKKRRLTDEQREAAAERLVAARAAKRTTRSVVTEKVTL